jgi:uncharacterized protein
MRILRRLLTRLSLVLLLMLFSYRLALALDCSKASHATDKLICGSEALKRADAEMSAAYSKLLDVAADADLRQALIASQRRWIKARYDAFDQASQSDSSSDDPEAKLLAAMHARANQMTSHGSSANTIPLLARLKQQRKYLARFSDDVMTGFDTDCSFAPDGAYVCEGSLSIRQEDKFCAINEEWTSGHTTDYFTSAWLKNAPAAGIAGCSYGYASTTARCPEDPDGGPADAATGWNFHIGDTQAGGGRDFVVPASSGKLSRLDADLPLHLYAPGGDTPGLPPLEKCVTDQRYPPRSLESRASMQQ